MTTPQNRPSCESGHPEDRCDAVATVGKYSQPMESDALVLAIRQSGVQTARIVHKSDAGLVQDCRWLDDPKGPSLVADYVSAIAANDDEIQPLGYGLIAVDFDRKAITSAQGYRDIGTFTAGEFGYPRHVGPSWLDWQSVMHHAFEREAVDSAIYTTDQGARCARIPLAGPARRRQTLALRFASTVKPKGYALRGFSFQPSGWTVRHINGAYQVPSIAAERAFNSLNRAGWRCAPLAQWKQCQFG